jgi:hypothetical protein
MFHVELADIKKYFPEIILNIHKQSLNTDIMLNIRVIVVFVDSI